MAGKSLGIKINIDYPSTAEIKSKLEGIFKNVEADIKLDIDKASINSLKDLLKQVGKEKKLKINFDSSKIVSEIQKIDTALDELREHTRNFKLFEGLDTSEINSAIHKTSQSSEKMAQSSKQTGESIREQSQALREMESVQREIHGLEVKKVGASQNTAQVYEDQITGLKTYLSVLKKDYKEAFGSDTIKTAVGNVEEFNLKLAKTKQASTEAAEGFKEYVKLLNKQQKLQQEIASSSTSSRQKQALAEQLGITRDIIQELDKEGRVTQNITAAQKARLEAIKASASANLEMAKASEQTSQAAQEAKTKYSELKSELREIHKIQTQIGQLDAKKEANVQTGKEEEKLHSLREQLKIRQEIHQANMQEATEQGRITQAQKDSLQAMQDAYDAKKQIRDADAKTAADLAKQNSLYQDMYASIKRVADLNEDLKTAGAQERREIMQQINAEKQVQATLQEQLNTHNLINSAKQEGIEKTQRQQAEDTQANLAIGKAAERDTYERLSLIGQINPMRVFSEMRQGAQYLHREMSALDDSIVGIERVVDASASQFDKFTDSMFDSASAVGKTVTEFNHATERWVTQGFGLEEGAKLAAESLVGAFIGNIDEEAMVDFMSVPLVAFKDNMGKAALDVKDVLNVMNEVANKNAVEMQDLGEAYKVAGQTAANAGTSFAELTGLITGANDATRLGGATIGRALRNIDLNVGKVGAGLTKTDQDRQEFFKSIGISFKTANGEMKSTYQILNELQGRWKTLNADQKNAATQYLAQKRNAPILQALMTNWEAVAKATGEANQQLQLYDKSSGSAYQEFEKKKESIEFATAALQNSWSEFLYNITGGREGVVEIINMINDFAQSLVRLSENEALVSTAKDILKFVGTLAMLKAAIMGLKLVGGLGAGLFGDLTKPFDMLAKLGGAGDNAVSGGIINFAKSLIQAQAPMKSFGSATKELGEEIVEVGVKSSASTSLFSQMASGIGSTSSAILAGAKAFGIFALKAGLVVGAVAAIGWGVNKLSEKLTGQGVWDNLKDMGTKIADSFKSNSTKIREAIAKQEEALQRLRSTAFIQGETGKMQLDFSNLKIKYGNLDQDIQKDAQKILAGAQQSLQSIADSYEMDIDTLMSLNPHIEDPNVELPENTEIVIEGGEIIYDAKTGTFTKEGFESIQEEIDSFVKEFELEEYNINLKVNSKADVEHTFKKMGKAIKDKATKQVVEAFEETGKAIEATGKLSELTKQLNGSFQKAFEKMDLSSIGYDKGSKFRQTKGNEYGASRVVSEAERFAEFIAKADDIQKAAVKRSALRLARDDEAWQQAQSAFNAHIQTILQARQEMAKQLAHTDLDIRGISTQLKNVGQDIFSSGFAGTLTGAGLQMNQLGGHFADLISRMRQVKEAGGEVGDNIAKIPHHVLRSLAEVIPELQGMPDDIRAGDWEGLLGDIDGFADQFGSRVSEMSDNWQKSMRQMFLQNGMVDQWNAITDNAGNLREGVYGVIDAYRELANAGKYSMEQLGQFMGFNAETVAFYGDDLLNKAEHYQQIIDSMPEDKVTRLSLITEDGTVDLDKITQIESLPEVVRTRFQLITDTGDVDFDRVEGMMKALWDTPGGETILKKLDISMDGQNFDLDKLFDLFNNNYDSETAYELMVAMGLDDSEIQAGIDEWKAQNISIKAQLDKQFLVEVGEMKEEINSLDEIKPKVKAILDNEELMSKAGNSEEKLKALDGLGINARAGLDTEEFKLGELVIMTALGTIDNQTAAAEAKMSVEEFNNSFAIIMAALGEIDGQTAETVLGVSKDQAEQMIQEAKNHLAEYSNEPAESEITANNDQAIEAADKAKEHADTQTGTMKIDGDNSLAKSKIENVKTYAQTQVATMRISATVDIVKNIKERKIKASQAIREQMSMAINPYIGRSFSSAIKEVEDSVPNMKTAFSKNSKDDARVNEDVWRYWAKQLYNGTPINSSMDDLKREIQRNNENFDKLIPLYQKQTKLIDRQIKHEQDLLNAQQSEMGKLLGDLRKYGFRTSGNQVTNLGHAKSLRGERASEAEKTLNDWKSLYETMEKTRQTINGLRQDRWQTAKDIEKVKKSIEEEKIKKELEKIEKQLKISERLAKSIENNTSVISEKMGLLDSQDFELNMNVNEEGMINATSNVKRLTDEFNRLSAKSVEYGENAEHILQHLEKLKGEILSNADAILNYRNALKDLRIKRFADDFAYFTNVMEQNIGRVRNNIDTIREGLVSGETLGGQVSSAFIEGAFNRRSEIEQQHARRLQLEEDLNRALERYEDKRVERKKEIAEKELQIESSKYSQLLALEKGYQAKQLPDVGLSNMLKQVDKREQTNYLKWQGELISSTIKYRDLYRKLADTYDGAMKKARTAQQAENIRNQMLMNQLSLQRKMYEDMIKANDKAINKTNEMLNSMDLTTSQRQDLQNSIRQYEQANIDAHKNIREVVKERFELELGFIQKVTDRSQKYTDRLNKILEIAESVKSSDRTLINLNKAILSAQTNQYGNAIQLIEHLEKKQKQFDIGSVQYNMIQDRIEQLREGLSQMTLDILNTNKNLLERQIDQLQKRSERLALGGLSLDQFKRQNDEWTSGIAKEYELERLRGELSKLEDQTLLRRLEIMDRQERISNNELEYVDKLIEAQKLREKINTMESDRNIKTLGVDENGNWEWQYVSDNEGRAEAEAELRKIETELEKFINQQQANYVSEMNEVMSGARSGEFGSVDELQSRINEINSKYNGLLGNGLQKYDTDAIISAYQQYLQNNNDIVEGTEYGTGGKGSQFAQLSSAFVHSFDQISEKLAKMIGGELKAAIESSTLANAVKGMTIENQYLEFPNVTDASAIEEAIRTLPDVVRQHEGSK